MAKIAEKILWWKSVNDAYEYNIRIVPDNEPFNYDRQPAFTVQHDPVLAEHEQDLAGTTLDEGVYDIYLTAVDPAGNESDPLPFADAVLDFTPPSAPASGGFR